jgi:hypothetical protein
MLERPSPDDWSCDYRPTTSSGARARPHQPTSDFRRICPNCGNTLTDRECKSRCPRCHFFTDCTDPW